jgi:hypothetical protein
VALWWVIAGRRISSETGTIQVMEIQKSVLWDTLENEVERAYRAFEYFLSLSAALMTFGQVALLEYGLTS